MEKGEKKNSEATRRKWGREKKHSGSLSGNVATRARTEKKEKNLRKKERRTRILLHRQLKKKMEEKKKKVALGVAAAPLAERGKSVKKREAHGARLAKSEKTRTLGIEQRENRSMRFFFWQERTSSRA